MTPEITPVASEPTRQLEIGEKPGDTPRSVIGNRSRRGLVLAVATTTQILNPAYVAINDPILMARNMTGYRDEEFLPEDGVLSPLDEAVLPEEEIQLSSGESANRDRLELLARAYVAGQLSTEEEARLAIVSERVRRLIPRVTVQDFEGLERIAIDLERIGSEDAARRRRLQSC